MSNTNAIIRPDKGLVVLILALGVEGILTEQGIEFNAGPNQVAEAAVIGNRPDLLKYLRHFDDGKLVQYTPQGFRHETELSADNIAEILELVSEDVERGIDADQKTHDIAVAAGLVPAFEEFDKIVADAEKEVDIDKALADHPVQITETDVAKVEEAEVAHTDAQVEDAAENSASDEAENPGDFGIPGLVAVIAEPKAKKGK